MRLRADVRAAVRSLTSAPVRSFLVLQGIAWGVGLAIFPAAVLEGSRKAAVRDATELGTGRSTIVAEAGSRPLTVRDADALRDDGRGRFQQPAVAPYRSEPDVPADAGSIRGAIVDLFFCGVDGAAARGQSLAAGRALRDDDFRAGAEAVAVLEPLAAEALFPGGVPGDARVTLHRIGEETLEVRVVGVFAPRSARTLRTDDFGLETQHPLRAPMVKMLTAVGAAPPKDDWKRAERGVHLPLSLAVTEDGPVDGILLSVIAVEGPIAADRARAVLVERGASPLAYSNLVWPVFASRQMDRYLRLKDALMIACLAMGGVVIAHLLLLSLMERTVEIAVRRAEGATRGDIALQFLAEAGLLGAVGAALGLPLGMGLAWIRVSMAPYSTVSASFPGTDAAVAVFWAVLVSLGAGVLPAVRAARLDPVQGLRGGS